jgi:hypothetical protein
MHRFAVVAAMCIFVAACAGTVKEGMSRLQGQPLSVVIAKIGEPNDERTVAGKTVYIWGAPGPSEKEAKQTGCQIQAIMNGDLIDTFDYQGDEKLCQRYAARLRP